jgi:hypothetical protein
LCTDDLRVISNWICRLNDINQVQVYCLPNNLITETMYFNKSKETVFTIAFDVLHDISIAELKQSLNIACTFQYKGRYHMTETCLIEWLGDQDLTWFSEYLVTCKMHVTHTNNNKNNSVDPIII